MKNNLRKTLALSMMTLAFSLPALATVNPADPNLTKNGAALGTTTDFAAVANVNPAVGETTGCKCNANAAGGVKAEHEPAGSNARGGGGSNGSGS